MKVLKRAEACAEGVVFAEEVLADAWFEGEAFFRANHAESGVLDPGDFAPDRKRYLEIEKAGTLRLFTMRAEGKKLVGYGLFFVVPHLHYSKVLWAMQDVLYVDPAYRGRSAVRFIRWTDSRLRDEGVGVVYRHVSVRRDYSRTLERMGYVRVECGFMRRF